jgi:hypothetical protein
MWRNLYLFGAENSNVSVDGGGFEEPIHKVLLHPEAILIDQAISKLAQFLLVGIVGWRPLGQAVPPPDCHILHQSLFRVFLFHLHSFHFLPRLTDLLALLHPPLFLGFLLVLPFGLRL